jgi:hypothetical protein
MEENLCRNRRGSITWRLRNENGNILYASSKENFIADVSELDILIGKTSYSL